MADSIFDNRYRYDYIYPRGRSGETLRAVDIRDADRPVVIKRPAPQDAPPIRSGQEVSILNERKALTRLVAHPAVTPLLGGGQFGVSGATHQYIVMDRAVGVIIADQVLELARNGQRFPELEMLVIVDQLLDLLHNAHAHDIVYNDVDAKHLFWDRPHYHLTVIDWGNAIFLEGDEITPQGISRQSDIYQVGELLFFIVTGGSRADIPRDAGGDFRLTFEDDSERVHSRLQTIISRAVHPNPKLRYKTILELRKDLTDYRAPLERDRNALIGRVNERLRRDLSKSDLNGLLRTLEPALTADPGHPAARQAQADVQARLTTLDVEADLDAARIYVTSGSWGRAAQLLTEIRPRAGEGALTAQIDVLLDWAAILTPQPPEVINTPVIVEAVRLVFGGKYPDAAALLVAGEAHDPARRGVVLLLADAIASRTSGLLPADLLLLRPPLHRLQTALAALTADGLVVTEPRAVLREIDEALTVVGRMTDPNLVVVRDRFRAVVDDLTALSTLVDSARVRYDLSEAQLPSAALERAINAAMALADNMHVIGKQAAASPRDALGALDASRAIDPLNPAWDKVSALLNRLYQVLGKYQTYIPNADGNDLDNWLIAAKAELLPFNERLFDEMLSGMTSGVDAAARGWKTYAESAIQGNRVGAITALANATEAVGTVSPTLAGWLNQLRTVVTNANYIERHALYGALGRALADGWEHFDRGRLIEAERLGGTAFEAARDDKERFAARRLRDLAATTREWVERTNALDLKRTETALTSAELLYTADEIGLRDGFNAQMPSKDTFLKAMNKGLVDLLARRATASVRVLFVNYVLLGALDTHEDQFEDAGFWRDASVRVLGESSVRHPLVRALDEFIQRRRDLNAAADLLNTVITAPFSLDASRKALEENAQAKVLAGGVYGLREIEAALRDWSDGEFRAAGIKLENALKAVDEVESAANITLTNFRAALMEWIARSAELHANARRMTQIIEGRPADPSDALRTGHQLQVDVTAKLFGESYAVNLSQWREMYESFLALYTDRTLRRSARLARFNDLFGAMFIDRHPAYPLYRHWLTLVEQSSEFPAPPTDDPTPRMKEGEVISERRDPTLRRDQVSADAIDDLPSDGESRPRRRLSPVPILLAVVALVLIGAAVVILSGGLDTDSGVTGSPTAPSVSGGSRPTRGGGAGALVIDATEDAAPVRVTRTTVNAASPTPLVINTLPTDSPAPPTATATRTATITRTPAPTSTPTDTATVTLTPTRTASATLTPPPQGVQGQQDVLALLGSASGRNQFWDDEQFSYRVEDGTAFWRLGTGASASEGIITIVPPAALLNARYGNDAPRRIVRVEATISLITYNPPLLIDDAVYFGMLMQEGENPGNVTGVELRFADNNVLNVGQRVGDDVDVMAQRAYTVGQPIRVRMERTLSTDTLTLFVENTPVGQPIPFAADDVRVFPVLYVKEGGVIVHVTAWTITLL